MPLYIGRLENVGGHRCMFVSSVHPDGEAFDHNSVRVEYEHRAARGDDIAERGDLNKLRNVLVAGGAHVITE